MIAKIFKRMNAIFEKGNSVNPQELEANIKAMYREVALYPENGYHFEMGRALAERLGYPADLLNQLPEESIQSFAGVGYHFQMAQLKKGEIVLDLGSGSGMDTFFAAKQIGDTGEVIGLDMTPEQLTKAESLREKGNFSNTIFMKSYIEELPVIHSSIDVVISNGVINLSADKRKVFQEAYRVLKPGGRLAISDIVAEIAMPEQITCNAILWAACIGGAMQEDAYYDLIESVGFQITEIEDNDNYRFRSRSAAGTSRAYGVRSISLLAVKG